MNISFVDMSNFVPIEEKAKSMAWRLRSCRKDLHWNQETLAEKSGVSRGHIASIESGRTINVTVDVAFALADALGVSRAYLLGMTEDPLSGVPDMEELNIPAQFKKLVELYEQLGDDERKNLLSIIEGLAKVYVPRTPE